MFIDRFPHDGLVYEFHPPIEVSDQVKVVSMGQLVGIAIAAASPHMHPEVAERLRISTSSMVITELETKPELALITLQAALKGKHTVTLG